MIRLPWRRPRALAPITPRPVVVQDGAGELGLAGQGAYSFTLRPDLEGPVRLAERLPVEALVRQLEELEEA